MESKNEGFPVKSFMSIGKATFAKEEAPEAEEEKVHNPIDETFDRAKGCILGAL